MFYISLFLLKIIFIVILLQASQFPLFVVLHPFGPPTHTAVHVRGSFIHALCLFPSLFLIIGYKRMSSFFNVIFFNYIQTYHKFLPTFSSSVSLRPSLLFLNFNPLLNFSNSYTTLNISLNYKYNHLNMGQTVLFFNPSIFCNWHLLTEHLWPNSPKRF